MIATKVTSSPWFANYFQERKGQFLHFYPKTHNKSQSKALWTNIFGCEAYLKEILSFVLVLCFQCWGICASYVATENCVSFPLKNSAQISFKNVKIIRKKCRKKICLMKLAAIICFSYDFQCDFSFLSDKREYILACFKEKWILRLSSINL